MKTMAGNVVRRMSDWRKSITRWKTAGKPVRSDEEVERISAICQACEHYNQKWQQCKLCGCFCRKRGMAEFNKPKMATEQCPLEPPKWGADNVEPPPIVAPMDVVYPLSSGRHGRKVLGSKWGDNELRYSLRSLEQYFPNLGRVFIVTEILPDWLTNVVHVYAKDVHTRNKDANLIDKVLLACKAGVSNPFLRLSDDQCLLKPWDGKGVWHMGDADGQKGGKWWTRCRHTCEHLTAQGHPTFFYDCHCPAAVDRDEFIRVAEAADYATVPGMCINTLYFNSVDIPRERMDGQKLAVHRAIGPKKLKRLAAGKLFLGYSEAGTNRAMRRFLRGRFPEPSRWEL